MDPVHVLVAESGEPLRLQEAILLLSRLETETHPVLGVGHELEASLLVFCSLAEGFARRGDGLGDGSYGRGVEVETSEVERPKVLRDSSRCARGSHSRILS